MTHGQPLKSSALPLVISSPPASPRQPRSHVLREGLQGAAPSSMSDSWTRCRRKSPTTCPSSRLSVSSSHLDPPFPHPSRTNVSIGPGIHTCNTGDLRALVVAFISYTIQGIHDTYHPSLPPLSMRAALVDGTRTRGSRGRHNGAIGVVTTPFETHPMNGRKKINARVAALNPLPFGGPNLHAASMLRSWNPPLMRHHRAPFKAVSRRPALTPTGGEPHQIEVPSIYASWLFSLRLHMDANALL